MSGSFSWFSNLWKSRKPEEVLQQHLIKLDESVGDELGRGAFGSVFKVKYNGASCVAKRILEILTGLGAHEQVGKEQYQYLLDKFKAECDLLSNLRHPNVVQFIGICQPTKDPRHLTLVMEEMHTSLDSLIKSGTHKPIDEGVKLQILLDVSAGLIHIHSHGVIHRDLNAGNVLLTRDLRAKIADFGMSRILPSNAPLLRSDMTAMPGAPDFMPPEAMTGSYDKKLDTFSFGHLMLYLVLEEYPAPRYYSHLETRNMKAEDQIEIKKRSQWLDKMTGHILYELAIDCLKDDSKNRPTIDSVNKRLKECMRSDYKDYCGLLKCKLGQYQTAITEMIRQLDIPVNNAFSIEINDLKRQLEERRQQEVLTNNEIDEKDTEIATKDREIERLTTMLNEVRMELTEQSDRHARDKALITLEKDANIVEFDKALSELQKRNAHYQQEAAELNQQLFVSAEQKKELQEELEFQNEEKSQRIIALQGENRELKNQIKCLDENVLLLQQQMSNESKRANNFENNYEVTLRLKENLEKELQETKAKLTKLEFKNTEVIYSMPSTPCVQNDHTNETEKPIEVSDFIIPLSSAGTYDPFSPAQCSSYVVSTEFSTMEEIQEFIPPSLAGSYSNNTLGYIAPTEPVTELPQANAQTSYCKPRSHSMSYTEPVEVQHQYPKESVQSSQQRFSYIPSYDDDDDDNMSLTSLQVKLKRRLQKMGDNETEKPIQHPPLIENKVKIRPPPVARRTAKTLPRHSNLSRGNEDDESDPGLKKWLQKRREKSEQKN